MPAPLFLAIAGNPARRFARSRFLPACPAPRQWRTASASEGIDCRLIVGSRTECGLGKIIRRDQERRIVDKPHNKRDIELGCHVQEGFECKLPVSWIFEARDNGLRLADKFAELLLTHASAQ